MSKFKFIKQKEKLTEQEIQQQMNFDKFISGHTPPVKGWMKGTIKLSGLLVSAVLLIALAGYIFHKSAKQETAAAFINPPVQKLDPASETFSVNTDVDTTVVHTDGTLITLPAGSFVDDDGKDIKGKVQLHYREFHDPIDILLSGIPMNYDSAGTTYQLESAGMFEITASRDGKPLHLKPGKQLLVNMISRTNNPVDYNIYALDTVKRKWEYVSENTAANKTCIPAFDDHFPALEKSLADKKPVLPKRADPEAANFSIDFQKDEFPELAVYKGLKFEPVKGDKNYQPSLAKKTWEDVLIEKHPDNEHYIVTFTSGKESHSFTVSPVVDEKDYAATLKDYEFRQKRYEQLLDEKKKTASGQSDSLYKVNAFLNGAVLRSDQNARFSNFISNNYMETSGDMLAYRTFSVRKLGIWNSDKPCSFFVNNGPVDPQSGNRAARFVSQDNEPLMLRNVYLIRRDINAIFPVAENNFKHFPSCKTVNLIVGVTYGNQLVYIKDEDLKKTPVNENNVSFKMKTLDAGVTNPQQLKALLKI